MLPLETTAVIVNVVGVWLTARRNMMCWPIGIVGVTLYLRQFYLWHLYGDMLLQGVYILVLIYGWHSWKKTQNSKKEIGIYLKLSPPYLSVQVIVAACIALPIGWSFTHFTDDPQPYLDSLLMCLSLLASIWTTRKYIENWYLWIVIDFIYAVLFLYRKDILTASLYGMFDLLALYGAYQWKRTQREI